MPRFYNADEADKYRDAMQQRDGDRYNDLPSDDDDDPIDEDDDDLTDAETRELPF